MNSEEQLFESVKMLEMQINQLQKLVHLQLATIQALQVYTTVKIAALQKVDRGAALKELAKIVRAAYKNHIEEIRRENPSFAADIDLGGELSKQDQKVLGLASKYFSKKARSGNGGNGD